MELKSNAMKGKLEKGNDCEFWMDHEGNNGAENASAMRALVSAPPHALKKNSVFAIIMVNVALNIILMNDG